jgi:GNAT superfamily N-acetyltransferase
MKESAKPARSPKTPTGKARTARVTPTPGSLHSGDLVFREVVRSRWPDMERLFESRGGPKSCWCMVWRATPDEARRTDGFSRKAAMARRVAEGTPVGILGYLGGDPVAWCSVAPRSTYRRLGGEDSPSRREEVVWSIVCFFVKRDVRGAGVLKRLIEEAVAHAGRNGATVVEAYPVDPDSPSYRFMGFVSSFADAGFHEVGRAGTRRHVMRRELA